MFVLANFAWEFTAISFAYMPDAHVLSSYCVGASHWSGPTGTQLALVIKVKVLV